MENEKQLITTELLGIRAGLSMISQYTDEIKQKEAKKESEHQKTQTILSTLALTRTEERRDKCDELTQSIAKMERDCVTLRKEISQHRAKAAVKKLPREAKGELDSNIISLYMGGIFGSLVAGFPIFLVPVAIYKHVKQRRDEFKSYKSYHQNQASALTATLRETSTALERDKQALQVAIEERERAAVEKVERIRNLEKDLATQQLAEAEIAEKCDAEIAELAEKSHVMNNALRDTYGFFLSESDWQNIDLIIHYVETGRADTLKEALYQVDRQRQNDRLVIAIQEASASIGTHVESAFSRMGEALSLCFERLDSNLHGIASKLQGVSVQLESTREASASANSALLQRLDEQISATRLNASLLEKANESSDQLLHDLRYNQKYWIKD